MSLDQAKNTEKAWKLAYNRFKPKQESLREALCSLGNGYLGTRGAACESSASKVHYPGTYIAGLYNILETPIAGRAIYNEDLVNCPNWMFIAFRIGRGKWITPSNSRILKFYQELDMRRGLLKRSMILSDKQGRVTLVEERRFVSMADMHRSAIKYSITPQNYQEIITLRSSLDGTVQNTGVARYRQLNSKHLKSVANGKLNRNIMFLTVMTSQSMIKISQAAKSRIFDGKKELRIKPKVLTKDKKRISQEFRILARKQATYTLEKVVAVYTSKDKGIRNPQAEAVKVAKNSFGFNILFSSHKKAWADLWRKFDIQVQGDDFSQQVIRLHTFHLLQTASLHNVNIDAGLPARGLSGEAYRGHIFWDTMYVLPFYDLHLPEIAQSLILYRFRRLDEARKYAKQDGGYAGSMFPWQSGSSGKEETQVIHLNPLSGKWGPDHSRIQRHVSFAIAYNVWHHWNHTQDLNFLNNYGAEMLLSISKFGASLTKFSEKDKRYHTDELMGPDEFHEKLPGRAKPGFRDNAYTNLLIVWTMLKSLEILKILPETTRVKLLSDLKISKRQLQRWEDITRKMNIIVNEKGIISQFDGYFGLQELNWGAYRAKYGNIQRMDRILKAEGKSPDRYKLAKQADTLMMFYLFELSEIKDLFFRLGYVLDKHLLKKNYEYYVQRTSHGSTLSKVVHCYIANLLGRLNESWKWFLEVLKSDIYDIQGGTTPEGIHCGVMGGSLNIVMRGFAGIQIREDSININPNLPKSWNNLKLRFSCKGIWITLEISKNEIDILIKGKKGNLFNVPIVIYGKQYNLTMGELHKISLKERRKAKQWGTSVKMAQERILIVGGDVAFAKWLKAGLEDIGYVADNVASGVEALDFLSNKWVDLIIISVNLEGNMDGFRLLKEIKSRSELKDLPIIVNSSKPSLKKVFEYVGVAGYLVKPVSDKLILDKIREVLNK